MCAQGFVGAKGPKEFERYPSGSSRNFQGTPTKPSDARVTAGEKFAPESPARA